VRLAQRLPCLRYKGFGPTLLTGAPYVGLQMSLYDTLKREARSLGLDRSVVAQLGLGAVAGLIAQTGAIVATTTLQ
jgi:hypothetical protein